MRERPGRIKRVSARAAVAGGLAVLCLAMPETSVAQSTPIAALNAPAETASEAASDRGRSTGLPVPRYVSLKAGRANVRRGPGTDFPIDWVYIKRGVPLEVTAESDHWRRVRDHEGDGGWIWHTMLAGERSAIVLGDKDAPQPLHQKADTETAVVAYLEPGIVTTLRGCKAGWCRIEVQGHGGWIAQDALWGVYPGESFE